MDDLDRVFHRLVSNIRHRHSEYLTLPFTVQELYETLIPYRHHRRELGIETNQDYEIAITRLLSGERGYLQADQEMRDKLQAELGSSHADTGAFREFANSKVSLAPEALRRIRALTVPAESGSAAASTKASGGTAAQQAGAASAEPPPASATSAAPQSGGSGEQRQPADAAPAISATFPLSPTPVPSRAETASEVTPLAISSLVNVSVPEGCPFCGGTLPEGRSVVYCPHCGNNLSVSRCPACGGELEKGWKFCVACGRAVG
jgi:cobalamin biosynthesis Mg chelatase CobN